MKLHSDREGLPTVVDWQNMSFFLVDRDNRLAVRVRDPASLVKEGRIVLDFNRAFNPPCAFTPFATCPLPPPENWLQLRINAGEMKPSASHGKVIALS